MNKGIGSILYFWGYVMAAVPALLCLTPGDNIVVFHQSFPLAWVGTAIVGMFALAMAIAAYTVLTGNSTKQKPGPVQVQAMVVWAMGITAMYPMWLYYPTANAAAWSAAVSADIIAVFFLRWAVGKNEK